MMRDCPHCKRKDPLSDSRRRVRKDGRFLRKSDGQRIQKYRCQACSGYFSAATSSDCRHQKKRHLNTPIGILFASGLSQRRLALYFGVARKTIERKLLFLGTHAEKHLHLMNLRRPPAKVIEFDDLVTFEHTKLKPVSVIAAVVGGERWAIDLEVASMPSFGKLKSKSVAKYGPRKDTRKSARSALFKRIQPFVAENALFKSDESPHYPKDLKCYFPGAKHERFKGRRGCVVGQGELKAGGFDPLFSLNHTYAMLRANVNRLFRRTWNTTKKIEKLRLHLFVYCEFHNRVLLGKGRSR